MTQEFSASLGSTLLFFGALLLLLYATYQAYKGRAQYQKLIAWGAAADLGFIVMAMAASHGLAHTGALLFALFQCVARTLAFTAYSTLSYGRKHNEYITHNAQKQPFTAALFALAMLAAVGGSPFLVPEGRFFATQGILATHFVADTFVMVLMALSSTVFVWLHIQAVREVYLETQEHAQDVDIFTSLGQSSFLIKILLFLIIIFGFLRAPLADMCAAIAGASLSHTPTPLAFIVLFVGAFVCALLSQRRPELLEKSAMTCMGIAFLCAGIIDDISPMARLFALLITGMGLVVTLYSTGYMRTGHHLTRYYFFLLLTFAALVGIVSTPNLGAFYGYWELMTFASYFLVVHEARDSKTVTVLDAGTKYYVMCAGGALLMLPGLALLGAHTAQLTAIAEITNAMPSFTLKVALILTLAGFVAKAGLLPLHAWLPEAHPAAPSSVSAPLSGIITKMGIFGIITLLLGEAGAASLAQHGLAQGGLSWIGYNLSFLGGATLIYGEIMALRQDDIKRLLAYSTLGQVGEIVLVLGLGTYLSTVAALTHVMNHALMKDLLFLAGGVLILRTGSRKIEDLRGLGQHMPFTVSCMAVGLLAIMGLPPFAGFVGKFLMIQAAMQSGHWLMAALIVVGSLVGAVYYTRILRTLIFEKSPIERLPHNAAWEQSGPMSAALGILAFGCVLLGIFPQITQGLITAAAAQYFNATGTVDSAQNLLAAMDISWPIYVIVPMLGAFVPCILHRDRIQAGRAAVGILLFTALLVILFGQDLDGLSFGFALIVPLLGAINMTYALAYMEHSHSQWRFYAFFCAMCAGLLGLASATHLYAFFLFWEIMSSWALYFTLAHEGTKEGLHEAFKYFLFNLSGAGFIFLGVCLLGAGAPLSFMGTWPQGLQESLALHPWAGHAAYALLALGFVMKAAQLPLRIDWQMHPALAPTPVSGFISSVLLKSALLGLMKLFIILGGSLTVIHALNPGYAHTIQSVVMWIGGITIVMASMQALLSSNLKLIFIYSTVSQIGYMVLAIAVGGSLGYAGGLLHVVNHIFFKDLLFLMCGVLMFQSHKDSLQDLGGIGHKMPFTLTMFAIAGLSVVGIPPSSGFTSKWIIYHALMQANEPFLAMLSLIGSVITLAYIAKFLHTAFMGQPGPHLAHIEDASPAMRMPMRLLAGACIVLGVFPGIMLYPINGILNDYGIVPLHIALTGVQAGPAAWNATNMCLMMLVAFVGTWKALMYFVRKNSRITPVHSCGIAPEEASSRMQPHSVYGGLMTFWRESLLPTLGKNFMDYEKNRENKEK